MEKRIFGRLLALTLTCAAVGLPLPAEPGQGRGRVKTSRTYQDPACTKGYQSGYDLGLIDGREGQRYDPVRHRDYRDASRGYAASSGSRDGYKTNFRTGFRQGYEDGYREGTRTKK